jgi:RHS repeat-associated protein
LSVAHASTAAALNSIGYTYDPVGRRSSSATDLGLPLATPALVSQFDAGNRLVQSTGTSGPIAHTYDANGNLIATSDSTGVTSFMWDSRNRLTAMTRPGGARSDFLYDFADGLISQSDTGPFVPTRLRSFILDDLTNVAFISQSSGNHVSILTGQSMDEHLAAVQAAGQVEFGLPDALNSTTATTDGAGRLSASFAYEPFGRTTTTSVYPFQYTGRTPVGGDLYYYRTRIYDAGSGRFLSEDAIGFAGGTSNLYEYAFDDPIDFVDPTGQDSLPTFELSPVRLPERATSQFRKPTPRERRAYKRRHPILSFFLGCPNVRRRPDTGSILAGMSPRNSDSKEKRIISDASRMAAVINHINGEGGFNQSGKAK